MTPQKQRLTVTVDPHLVATANEAVAAGRAESLSGWVNTALEEKAVRERKLKSLSEAIAGYEAEFGAIAEEEMAAQRRADREEAVVVRRRRPEAKGGA